jgi:CspA family cold shock protein
MIQDNDFHRTQKCRLKWFNESKGFGFLLPMDGPQKDKDAFIHVSAFQAYKIRQVREKALFECLLSETENGLFVKEIISIDESGDDLGDIVKIPLAPDEGEVFEMKGSVKWYREDKGYGFIDGHDGEKDVFVHQSCLLRNKIEAHQLEKGTTVFMRVRHADQGREAVCVSLNAFDECEEAEVLCVPQNKNATLDHQSRFSGQKPKAAQENA